MTIRIVFVFLWATTAWAGTSPFFHLFDSHAGAKTPHYVNDHTLIQRSDGSWHLFGIYHAEPFSPMDETEFVHAQSFSSRAPFLDSVRTNPTLNLADDPMALRVRRDLGETHLWAPHVVWDGSRYVMVYQSGGRDNHEAQIRIAVSPDLNHWQRVSQGPLFTDICVARDPMLKKIDRQWVMYYTRCNNLKEQKSGVAYRVSDDLIHWSEPQMALVFEGTPAMFNSGYTESPFVFERGGWFYLSVTSYPVSWDTTYVFRSKSPFFFEPKPHARLRAHAPEWLEDPSTGQLYMTHCGAGQQGVWITPMPEITSGD